MNITANEAYRIAQEAVKGNVKIVTCYELSDRFLFGWQLLSGIRPALPAICVFKKSGEVALHDEYGIDILEGRCREEGVQIQLEDLQEEKQTV